MDNSQISDNLKKCLDAYFHKKSYGTFYPVYYGIEISRLCNFACTMCPHPKYKASEKGNMTMETFCRIIDEISPYAEIIKLHWIGEPLLNKNLVKMIRYAREKSKSRLFLSTNASLLEGDLAEDLRTSGLDKIIFSLDGNSAETFESIRIKGNFQKVAENIEEFIKRVDEYGGPICEVKLIQFNSNKHEIEEFRNRWKNSPNVIVHVMWLSSWAGQLIDVEEMSDFKSPYEHENRSACSDLWFKMQINWKGEVNLCCFDWAGTENLGNIYQNRLIDIWHGDALKKIRSEHLSGEYNGICRSCKEWAKIQEYEFWYDYESLKENASQIWYADNIPNLDISRLIDSTDDEVSNGD